MCVSKNVLSLFCSYHNESNVFFLWGYFRTAFFFFFSPSLSLLCFPFHITVKQFISTEMVSWHVDLRGAWGAVDTASFPWRSTVHFKIAWQRFFKLTGRHFFLNPWWQGRWVTGSQVSASEAFLTGDCGALMFVSLHLKEKQILRHHYPVLELFTQTNK